MKENLILKQFTKENVNGTFNLLEEETFFGSKVMEIEDDIIINDKSVQYFQYFYTPITSDDVTGQTLAKNNGYQYFELSQFVEDLFILDVVDLKLNNHTIIKTQQNEIDEKNNTKWLINIDIKNTLKEYLFSKIKERRTFKSLKYTNFLNNNINESVYNYIIQNLLDRYEFNYIDFYIKYTNITSNTIYSNLTLKQYDPQFDSSIELLDNRVTNVNVEINNYIDSLAPVKINYFQTKPSTEYKFDYYFNIHFRKI